MSAPTLYGGGSQPAQKKRYEAKASAMGRFPINVQLSSNMYVSVIVIVVFKNLLIYGYYYSPVLATAFFSTIISYRIIFTF
ncbi:MAG: hypothetical protein R2778_09855 [Saprospiraceae bacterium]